MHISRPAGGLSRRDLLRAGLGAWRVGPVVGGLVVAAALVLKVLAAEIQAHGSLVPLYIALSVLVGTTALASASNRAAERRPGAARHCPQLVEVAARAATENGLPAPSAVSIVGQPVIVVRAHRFPRRTVVARVGLPLLTTLSADELRGVLAHFAELAGREPADPAVPLLEAVPPALESSPARAYAKSFLSGNASPKPVGWEEIDPVKVFWPLTATEPVLEAAGAELGRPVTAVDAVELLATTDGRRQLARTLIAESDETIVGDPDEALRPGVAATAAVLHELLLHGYRRLDVLHHYRLTAPDGSVVDVNTATAEAFTSPEGLDRLRLLLSAAAVGSTFSDSRSGTSGE